MLLLGLVISHSLPVPLASQLFRYAVSVLVVSTRARIYPFLGRRAGISAAYAAQYASSVARLLSYLVPTLLQFLRPVLARLWHRRVWPRPLAVHVRLRTFPLVQSRGSLIVCLYRIGYRIGLLSSRTWLF